MMMTAKMCSVLLCYGVRVCKQNRNRDKQSDELVYKHITHFQVLLVQPVIHILQV